MGKGSVEALRMFNREILPKEEPKSSWWNFRIFVTNRQLEKMINKAMNRKINGVKVALGDMLDRIDHGHIFSETLKNDLGIFKKRLDKLKSTNE